MLQEIYDFASVAFRQNFVQIITGVLTVGVALVSAILVRKTSKESNHLVKRRLEFDQESKNNEAASHSKKRNEDFILEEQRLMSDRQEKFYESTQRLIASLEKRLESQAQEAHQERVANREEISGLRKTVEKLERRVAQLVSVFRAETGREPPPPESNNYSQDSRNDI